jgi:hypothetical protein
MAVEQQVPEIPWRLGPPETAPTSERDWRSVIINEAVYRNTVHFHVAILRALRGLPPSLIDDVIDAATSITVEGAGIAFEVSEALRSMHATPETDSLADREGKLVDVVSHAPFIPDDERLRLLDLPVLGSVMASARELSSELMPARRG